MQKSLLQSPTKFYWYIAEIYKFKVYQKKKQKDFNPKTKLFLNQAKRATRIRIDSDFWKHTFCVLRQNKNDEDARNRPRRPAKKDNNQNRSCINSTFIYKYKNKNLQDNNFCLHRSENKKKKKQTVSLNRECGFICECYTKLKGINYNEKQQ